MTLEINLKPEDVGRLRDLAEAQGLDAREYARRIIEERLSVPTERIEERLLNREEIDVRLRAAGVRGGDRERAMVLLDVWSEEDADTEGTVEEWEEIQRNIEQGTIDFRRVGP